MLRSVILEGDPTTHGGKVLEGYGPATLDGRRIARRGHITFCPKCKGQFAIIEGLDHHTFAGVGTALEGMKTACGAELIATQQRMKVDDGKESAAASPTTTEAPSEAPDAESSGSFHTSSKAIRAAPETSEAKFSGSFRAVDKETGSPIPDIPYRIELEDGSIVRGVTDVNGNTRTVTGKSAESIRLYWEVEPPETGDTE